MKVGEGRSRSHAEMFFMFNTYLFNKQATFDSDDVPAACAQHSDLGRLPMRIPQATFLSFCQSAFFLGGGD
eukprot:6669744-Prymnesium_polylepis.1